MTQIELREKYMQLSKKLLDATEEGRPEEEIKGLQEQLRSLEPSLTCLECDDAPDLP